MAHWIKCTNTQGAQIRVNMDHVAMILPHQRDRGFAGSEIVFSGSGPSSIIVSESEDFLTESGVERGNYRV
jgi:hypothetical protein